MLQNPDGSPYNLTSFNSFENSENTADLFNLWDEELIQISGSPIYYYEVIIPISTIDPLYKESRDKLYSKIPTKLFAVYEPIQSQNALNMFGIDSPDEMIFEMNYAAVIRDLGHLPKVGSRIHTPHLGENWKIIQRNLGEFKMWGKYRLSILCQKFQENITET